MTSARSPPQISVDTSVAARHRAGTPKLPRPNANAPPQVNTHNGQSQTQIPRGDARAQQPRPRARSSGKQGKSLALVMPESLQRSSTRSPTQSMGTPTSAASAFTPTGATRHYNPTPPVIPGSTSTPPKRPRKSALRKKSLSRLSGILRQTRSSGSLRTSDGGTLTFGFGRSSRSGSGGISSEDYAQTGHNNPLTKSIPMPKGPSRATMMRQESLKKFQSLLKTRPNPPAPPLPIQKRVHPMPKSILINRRQSKDAHDRSNVQIVQQPKSKPQPSVQQNSGATPAYPSALEGSTASKREGVRQDTRSSRLEPSMNSRKSAAVSVLDISPENNIEVVDDISSAFAKATNKRLPPTPKETPPIKQAHKGDALGSYFAVHPPVGRQSHASTAPTQSAPAKATIPPPLPKGGPVQSPSPPLAPNTKFESPSQPERLSHEKYISDAKARENAEIMSRLEEERRAIRLQNRENFNSRVWGPALSSELAEAMRLAAERSGTTEASEPSLTEDDEKKRYTLPPIQPLLIKKRPAVEEEKRNGARESETDWAQNVRLAMAKLENRIQGEASSDPKAFMRARRESAQLRAWVASQKRASEARLSALASGRARPQSPFEHEFVAQLLKESDEVRLKKSEAPMADTDRLFRGSNMTGMTGLTGTTATFGTGTLPRYTPFSLTPLREMEDETSSPVGSGSGPQASRSESVVRDRPAHAHIPTATGRMSTFEEKKAARRAGSKDYKTFSSAWSTSDMSVNPGAFCCNLGTFWKADKFKRST